MTLQHLQPLLAHPAECPPRSGVIGIVIHLSDCGGSVQFFSLALTIVCLMFLALFRLRHGLGTCSSSCGCGFIIDFRCLMSRSGVYCNVRNVSYLPLD